MHRRRCQFAGNAVFGKVRIDTKHVHRSRTHCVAADCSNDGLADSGEEGPALEELALEDIRDYRGVNARTNSTCYRMALTFLVLHFLDVRASCSVGTSD